MRRRKCDATGGSITDAVVCVSAALHFWRAYGTEYAAVFQTANLIRQIRIQSFNFNAQTIANAAVLVVS